MIHFKKDTWISCISILLIICLVFHTSGCATIFRGTQQTVTVRTNPSEQSVMYQGMEVEDGQSLTIQKRFDPPRLNVGKDGNYVPVDLQYDPDALLIADAALLFVFIVPGLVALAVDFGTGSWRNLHNPQVVYLPNQDSEKNLQEGKLSEKSTEVGKR